MISSLTFFLTQILSDKEGGRAQKMNQAKFHKVNLKNRLIKVNTKLCVGHGCDIRIYQITTKLSWGKILKEKKKDERNQEITIATYIHEKPKR